jgi:UDP-N-acetylglucosamine transferase subunit ALG13
MTANGRGPAGSRIVVSVGTDHHPFDRLISWTNDWLRCHPEHLPEAFVQSGTASVVPDCPGSPFVEAGELSALLDSAAVIVCHGGPVSIAEAWSRGQLPIVVPRVHKLGEHVDDHQVDFCRRIAKLGRIRLAQTAGGFAGLLDEATRDRTGFRARLPQADVDAAVARFGELFDDLVRHSRQRRSLTGKAHNPLTFPRGEEW